jgi:hypothetical protein
MNDEVGEAFFSFLHSVNLNGYHDQDFPATRHDLVPYKMARRPRSEEILFEEFFSAGLKTFSS